MKLIDIQQKFFRYRGGKYYCTKAETDSVLNVRTVHAKDPENGREFDICGEDINDITPGEGTELGAPYYAASDELPSIETSVPDSMSDDIHSAMYKLKEAVGGSTVDFVCERLQWSRTQISNYLLAEQVDAVALAVYNMEARSQAIIIGDQTGIGKGRMAASLIRYAHVHGKRAVFVTEGAKLFSDIYRDLCDTGSADLVPFIINNDNEANIKELDQNGECKRVIYTHLPDKESLKLMEKCELPKKYDYILGTYSQFRIVNGKNGKNSRIRAEFLLKLIEKENIVLILDEAHNAAGSAAGTDRYGNETQQVKASSTFQIFSQAVKEADSVCFLSATFAKKPDNMPLYALRSCLQDSGISDSDLIRSIKRGGEALQEIISASMVAEGQMIRREKSFDDIDVNYFYLDKTGEEKGLPNLEFLHRSLSDNVTELMREIIDFERKYITPVMESINDSIAGSGSSNFKSDNKMGITRSSYFSRIHNIIGQMLLSIKAEAVADHAIRRLKEGKKVVIAIAKTNESLLKDLSEEFGVKSNDGKTVRTDFAMSLLRGLRKCFDYTQKDEKGKAVKDENGKSAVFHIEVDQLPVEGQEEYAKLVQKISTAKTGIICSPIDIIEHKLLQAGYACGELTGRSVKIDFTDNTYKTGVIVTRKKEDPNSIIKAFQTNKIDVVLLNSSAATGVSLHATTKGTDLKPSEVKPRCMIIAECELNVSTEVQKRGRINRTGQIKNLPPSYDYLMSAVPCEQRNMMMLQKKLLSLDANTTSKQKQSTKIIDVPDFINKYGDQTVTQYLIDNPEFNEKLDDPLNIESDGKKKEIANGIFPAEAALKVSRLTATLKCDEQDDFYSNIMASYQQLITNLKQRGEYDLEVAEMPLNATLLGSKTVFTAPSSSGRSVFANASFLGRYECDVLIKPYSRSQVEGFLQAFKNEHPGKTPEEAANELAEDFERKAFAVKKVRELEINANYAVKLAELDKNQKLDNESREIKKQKIEDDKAAKLIKAEAECNRKRMRKGILQYFYAGRNCYDTDGYSICLGAKIGKAKNPYAPSNITIEFAAASSLKFYSYNLSDDGFRSLSMLKESTNTISKTDVLENWDSLIKNSVKNREIRRIITGNILAAYPEFIKIGDSYGDSNGKRFLGKLITFTLSDGSREKGILLPPTRDDDKGETNILASVPVDMALKYYKKQIKKQKTADYEKTFDVDFSKGITLSFTVPAKSDGVQYFKMKTPMRTKYYKEFAINDFWTDLDNGRGFYNSGNGYYFDKGGNFNTAPLNDVLFKIFEYCKKFGLQIETTQALANEIIGDVKDNEGAAWTPLFVDTSKIPCSETELVRVSPLLKIEAKLAAINGGGLKGTPENLIEDFQKKIWKDGFNSVTLNQLKDIIKDIQNGKHIQSDFGRLVRYGRPRHDSVALSAAVITRERIGTSSADRETDSRNGQTRITRQTELLTEFAKLSGCWISDYYEQPEDFVCINGKIYTYLAKGMENAVYDNLKTKNKNEKECVVKIINITPDWEHPFYYDFSQLFDRILIHNVLFPNTTLKVVGFIQTRKAFKIILQQLYVSGNAVGKNEINTYINRRIRNLKPNFNFYFNSDFIIGDFHRRNVLKAADGWLYVIDDILAFNHGDFKGLKGLGDTDTDSENESEMSEFMLDSSNYDNKHINNLAPNKNIPYSVIENLNKVGMTLESIDRLSAAGFPVCKYKTQVTVHGICPELKHGYVAGYKCLTINQNQSLGIRWVGIDSDKKKRIGAIANKIATVREKVEKTASFFYYRDSTVTSLRLVVCKVARQYPWIPEKAKEIAQDLVKKSKR
ncbi:MAG: strawberry notch family protein [Bacteroidales bacterium]|nr:strawberry notch family protein [Bacteroidales bacterium]